MRKWWETPYRFLLQHYVSPEIWSRVLHSPQLEKPIHRIRSTDLNDIRNACNLVKRTWSTPWTESATNFGTLHTLDRPTMHVTSTTEPTLLDPARLPKLLNTLDLLQLNPFLSPNLMNTLGLTLLGPPASNPDSWLTAQPVKDIRPRIRPHQPTTLIPHIFFTALDLRFKILITSNHVPKIPQVTVYDCAFLVQKKLLWLWATAGKRFFSFNSSE